MEQRFFICNSCLSVFALLGAGCLGSLDGEIRELTPGGEDSRREGHVPILTVDGSTARVKVGRRPHPMTEEHYIEWIWLETDRGGKVRRLSPGNEALAEFTLEPGERAVAAYALCNLHSLWVGEVSDNG